MSLQNSKAGADAVICSFEMSAVASSADQSITATLSYFADEPFSVRASFTVEDTPAVHWILSRDLLREGIALPSGLGDVRIYPGAEGLLLELCSDNGRAFLYAPIEPVIDFVGKIYALVPDGAEGDHFSIDDELVRLLDVPLDSDSHSSDSAQ